MPDPGAARSPDLLKRNFKAGQPGQLHVADFTCVPLDGGGFAYTAFTIDAYAGYIGGWECSRSKATAFVIRAIWQAAERLARAGHPLEGLAIHHSDAGSQPSTPRSAGSAAAASRAIHAPWLKPRNPVGTGPASLARRARPCRRSSAWPSQRCGPESMPRRAGTTAPWLPRRRRLASAPRRRHARADATVSASRLRGTAQIREDYQLDIPAMLHLALAPASVAPVGRAVHPRLDDSRRQTPTRASPVSTTA